MNISQPPAPIWRDENSDLAVWVNGAMIEFNMAVGWSGRLAANEAAVQRGGFAQAVADARCWAARRDGVARCHMAPAA